MPLKEGSCRRFRFKISGRRYFLYLRYTSPLICRFSVVVLHCPSHCLFLQNCYLDLEVRLSVRHCICVEKKNQLYAIEWFISLITCLTCFGHFYAHQQELETICVSLPPMVCSAWLLVVGVRCRTAGYVSRKRYVARRATSLFLDT